MAGLEGWILFRQLAPLCPSAQHPQHTMQYGARVVPRTAALIGPALWSQHRFHHFPLFVGQFPTATHRHIRRSAEHLQSATKLALTLFMRLVLGVYAFFSSRIGDD